jgi:hypothetical protein
MRTGISAFLIVVLAAGPAVTLGPLIHELSGRLSWADTMLREENAAAGTLAEAIAATPSAMAKKLDMRNMTISRDRCELGEHPGPLKVRPDGREHSHHVVCHFAAPGSS